MNHDDLARSLADVLSISGPAGVGKSSVAFEISLQLQATGTDHALIDTDELDRLFPVPDDYRALSEENLAAVWRGFARRGASRLILAGVYLDRPVELEWIARAVPGARFTLVRLVASDETIAERVRRRELGSGMDAQLGRSLHQAARMAADVQDGVTVVATDGRDLVSVAEHVLAIWSRRTTAP
jgi:gluconate kinase